MNNAAFHILLGLSLKPSHGYALMRQITQDSGGTVQLGAGALYGALKQLHTNGFIEEMPFEANNRRRYYRLTKKGWDQLQQQIAYHAHIVQLAHERHVQPH